jgi:hypothetical protein
LITGDEFGELFKSFEHTAFRLEPRDRYNDPGEHEPLRRFLAGEKDDLGWNRPWLDLMTEHSANGRIVRRVRVVTVPLTNYSRFGLWCAQFANEAGEEIRYLPRGLAAGLPDFDYWLFDSRQVARLHFDPDDQLLGAEIITDPATVVKLSAARDDAWHRSISRTVFESSMTKE